MHPQIINFVDLQVAREKDGRLIENLEEHLAVAPEEFLLRLSLTLRMPAATLENLRSETPEFGFIPYAECSRRCCVAVRDADGDLWVVLGDPYDLDTQEWIEARIAAPFRYKVAHRLDVTAYGNRVNAFGAVHNANEKLTWFGPQAWRQTGAAWAYEYQLRPMGVLVAPRTFVTQTRAESGNGGAT